MVKNSLITPAIQPGQRAVIMGMGVSGLAALKFLHFQGVLVSVSEQRQLSELSETDRSYLEQNSIPFEGGGHSEAFLLRSDVVVISPGIPVDLPLLDRMRHHKRPVLGELAVAASYLTEQVVAVTGTNGKTTVTALLGELLEESGKKVFVGGNIGTPLLDYLTNGGGADVLILELSSFQLESAGTFSPNIGLLLNVSPDHLDWHGSMENYSAAKMKLFAHQQAEDVAIVSGDCPVCRQFLPNLKDQRLYCFGKTDTSCAALATDHGVTIRLAGRQDDHYSLADTALDSHTGQLNAEAAVLAATLLGCGKDAINRGLQQFIPAAHRLQYVRTVEGVDYYDDSKATNTGAVCSALESFSGKVVLIAGGRDKGEDYSVLLPLLQKKVVQLILLGEAAEAIAAEVNGVVPVSRVQTMEEAVVRGAELAAPGEVVLLAPACASFDMFENYGQRGDVFSCAVMNLQTATGEKAA